MARSTQRQPGCGRTSRASSCSTKTRTSAAVHVWRQARCAGADTHCLCCRRRLSGSTAVTCLLMGNVLYCANVGDSRAVLATQEEPGFASSFSGLTAVDLSNDHKPDLCVDCVTLLRAVARASPGACGDLGNRPAERRRLEMRGARVAQLPDPDTPGAGMGPYRVWFVAAVHVGQPSPNSLAACRGNTCN